MNRKKRRGERIEALQAERHQILGWAVADACSHLDKGIDYRTVEMPSIAARAASDLKWHGEVPPTQEPDNE